MVFLVGFGAWALAAFVCTAFVALICRGGQLEDQLVAVRADHRRDVLGGAQHPLPAETLRAGFGPRSALDDIIRTAEQAEI